MLWRIKWLTTFIVILGIEGFYCKTNMVPKEDGPAFSLDWDNTVITLVEETEKEQTFQLAVPYDEGDVVQIYITFQFKDGEWHFLSMEWPPGFYSSDVDLGTGITVTEE